MSFTRRRSPRVNLRWSLWVGAWNVLSLREDDHPFLLSSELLHLNITIVTTEVQRPDCGEIMVGGYTYYWSGRSDGYHAQVVAVAVSNKLTPMIIEVTPVNERIMSLRIRHFLGVISLVSVYAPTEASDLTVKDAFYATLESVVDQCPRRDPLLVLEDFNASTGTDRDGYETCVGPYGSGTVNHNSTKFLNFARSHGLRVAGSLFQWPHAHRWTWYSNANGVTKEIDHVLIAGLVILMLVVWQMRLTMCSLMVPGG